MKNTEGEIVVAPRNAFWFFMSPHLGENFKIEMLKRDILVTSCNMDELGALREAHKPDRIYLFNFDGFLQQVRAPNQLATQLTFARKLAHIIKSFIPGRSVLHTSLILPQLAELFREEKILYVNKNLSDPRVAVPAVTNIAGRLIHSNEKPKRMFLRINLYPDVLVNFEVKTAIPENPKLRGVVKDLSLSGIGLVFNNPDSLRFLSLKDWVRIRVYLPGGNIVIQRAMIVRISPKENEVGLFFKLGDDSMIHDEDANALTNIVHSWLENVMKKHGKTADLNAFKVVN